jgi:hypothetical protein
MRPSSAVKHSSDEFKWYFTPIGSAAAQPFYFFGFWDFFRQSRRPAALWSSTLAIAAPDQSINCPALLIS